MKIVNGVLSQICATTEGQLAKEPISAGAKCRQCKFLETHPRADCKLRPEAFWSGNVENCDGFDPKIAEPVYEVECG